jgi:hypothetical protein
MVTAPEAQADREGEYHEFELRCFYDEDTTVEINTVTEGDNFDLEIKWHDRSGVGSWHATWDTKNDTATAGRDFVERDKEKHSKSELYSTFNHTFETTDDDWWEGPEYFYAGYDAVWKDAGDNHPAHHCAIAIEDNDTLRVKSVRAWGDPANDNTYRAGETIRLRFYINGKVHVPDNSKIWIYWDDSPPWRPPSATTTAPRASRATGTPS